MITGLDHVVVLVSDIRDGAAAYQTLFARTPSWQASGDGAERVLFTLDNMTLELVAPSGDGASRGSHSRCYSPIRARDWRACVFAPTTSPKCIAGWIG